MRPSRTQGWGHARAWSQSEDSLGLGGCPPAAPVRTFGEWDEGSPERPPDASLPPCEVSTIITPACGAQRGRGLALKPTACKSWSWLGAQGGSWGGYRAEEAACEPWALSPPREPVI